MTTSPPDIQNQSLRPVIGFRLMTFRPVVG
jgi:hypothetical protein